MSKIDKLKQKAVAMSAASTIDMEKLMYVGALCSIIVQLEAYAAMNNPIGQSLLAKIEDLL